MKPNSIKGAAAKGINIVIVALVVMGTLATMFVGEASEGGTLMSKLFLIFFGTIIALQIIPGLFLLGAMLKGLASLGNKETLATETKNSDGKS